HMNILAARVSRLLLLGLLPATLALAAPASSAPSRYFTVVEAGIADMQKAMQEGRVTSRELVQQYLARIATYEDKLNAAITVNPRALQEADALDRERAQKKVRGPLHGIPIAIKDNIQTTDMPTTGGALAFDGFVPPYEATVTKNLREAGAIIIAKTQMTELANWVAGSPAPMPNNYNGLNGYGFNPYDPRRDPREATFDGRPATSDPSTNACKPIHGYTPFLKADGLKGARIGIPRAFYCDKVKAPGSDRDRGGLNADQPKVMAEATEVLKKQGAVIVDPAD